MAVVTSSQVINTGYAVLALFADALVLLIVLGFILSRTTPAARERWARVRDGVTPFALHVAWIVAVLATFGSLFLQYVEHFDPCQFCWFQRICMYPLSILTLFLAFHGDHRAARYLLPLPVVGAGVSIYHLLIENKVISEPAQCLISAPGTGCGTKWINEFGYMTIPTLALTAFVLLIGFLGLAAAGGDHEVATLAADA